MFFFIGGIQPKTVILTKQARVCPHCGHPEICRKRVDNYLSLFFIPLFRVKKGIPFWICDNCKTYFDDWASPLTPVKRTDTKTCSFCDRAVGADYIYCPYCSKVLDK
jgi:RNA polymerase subunit RPABC4/transcription elongation factor Spt4